MAMEMIPVIASADDLEQAIAYAEDVPSARWYVTRRAKVLGRQEAIPASWNTMTASAEVPITASAAESEEALPTLQDTLQALTMSVSDFASADLDFEPLLASVAACADVAHEFGFADEFGRQADEVIVRFVETGRLDDLEMEDVREALTAAVRRVRTPEGADFYGQPIGTVIAPNVYLPTGSKLFSTIKKGEFFENDGKKYRALEDAKQSMGSPEASVVKAVRDSEHGDVTSAIDVKLASGEKVQTFRSAPKGAKAVLKTEDPKAKLARSDAESAEARRYLNAKARAKSDGLDEKRAEAYAKSGSTDDPLDWEDRSQSTGFSLDEVDSWSDADLEEALAEAEADEMFGLARKIRDVQASRAKDAPSLADKSDAELKSELDKVQEADDPDMEKQQALIDEIDRRSGLVTKSDAETKAVAEADIRADQAAEPGERVAAAQAKIDAARVEMDKYKGGTEERKAAAAKWRDATNELETMISELEDAGKGHLIPDNGNTIRVRNKAQKLLLEDELKGQISDGMWENSSPDWQDWSGATVIVDPKNVGRNWFARKDNYQLNSSKLLDIVGDRMVANVKDKHDGSYDDKKMRADLSDLRKIFKTKRPNHEGEIDTEDVTAADDLARGTKSNDALKRVASESDDSEIREAAVRELSRRGDTNFETDRDAANAAARKESSSPEIKVGDKVRTTAMTWHDDDGWANGVKVVKTGTNKGERYVVLDDGNELSTAYPDRGGADVVQVTGPGAFRPSLPSRGGRRPLKKAAAPPRAKTFEEAAEAAPRSIVKRPADHAGAANPTGSTGTAPDPTKFIDDRQTSLGTVKPDAKGNDPERFVPKSSFADGTTPASGDRVRDKKGRTGTVTETYQLYTAVKWDDNGKVQTVKNDRLNGGGSSSAPARPTPDEAAGKGKEATVKAVDDTAKTDTGGVGQTPGAGRIVNPVATLSDASHNLFKAFWDDAGNWSGNPWTDGNVGTTKQERGNLTDLKRKKLITTGDDDGDAYIIFTDKGRDYAAAEGWDTDAFESWMTTKAAGYEPSTAASAKSPAELIIAGVYGKELRDALRRENPNWSNAQVHTVANRMAKAAGLRASGAEPTTLELMRVRSAIKAEAKKIGLI